MQKTRSNSCVGLELDISLWADGFQDIWINIKKLAGNMYVRENKIYSLALST